MTILDFLALTWEWITAEYQNGNLDQLIQRTRNVINITEARARQWWHIAQLLNFWGIIISLIIFLVGILVGGITNLGWPNSITGLLIAPILFVLLVWWTPLVAVIAVIWEIAHLRIKCTPEVALAQAKWWMGITCGILLWQVILSLAFTFIPYWNAPSRIPILMLLGLALALMGLRWNNSGKYRSVIKFMVVVIFITQILVCFFPATSSSLHSLLGRTDNLVAEKIEGGELFSSKTTEAQLVKPGFETLPFGTHIVKVNGISPNWIMIPPGAHWDVVPMRGDVNWKIVTFRGKRVSFGAGEQKVAEFPNEKMIFKIQTDGEHNFIVNIKPLNQG